MIETIIQNAASIVGLILATEAVIADVPEKDERAGGGMPGGMGMGI